MGKGDTFSLHKCTTILPNEDPSRGALSSSLELADPLLGRRGQETGPRGGPVLLPVLREGAHAPWHRDLASPGRAKLLPPSSHQPHTKRVVCIRASSWPLLQSYALWGLPAI